MGFPQPGAATGVNPPAGDLGGTTVAPTVVATHLSAALPIAQGGTASATAAAALAALGGTALAGDLGGTSAAPTVVATHLAAALPIAQGGTAAITAPLALAALGAPAIAGDLGGTSAAPTVTGTHLGTALPINQGGTGQTTAAAALAALGGTTPNVTVTTQAGTTYTFILADADTVVEATAASAATFTLPLNASVAYPVGTILTAVQGGAGKVSFAAGGTTMTSPGSLVGTRAQWSTISALKIATDSWVLSGDLA